MSQVENSKMKKIAVIDPYMVSPANDCFKKISTTFPELNWSHHFPHHDSFESINSNEFDAFIVLGSASHVYQKLEWHLKLKDFLLNELNKSKPVLGICFGHQLMCDAFGAQVEFYSKDEAKIAGVGSILINKSFLGFNENEKLSFAVTHRQVVKNLPACLIEFGQRSEPHLQNDCVYHINLPFIGTQAHVEASDEFCKNESMIELKHDRDLTQINSIRFLKHFLQDFKLVSK
jgi:GMP synthase (glutamine-hydrolysing)